jgi:hypothetical protein
MQHQHQLLSKKLSISTNSFAATALKREREREMVFSPSTCRVILWSWGFGSTRSFKEAFHQHLDYH